jgi:flap endonuclease-1
MGIKNLNKFVREKCPNSIHCISMSELQGKSIAVDISIYIYKYHSEESLLENIYLMMMLFRNYGIIPVFVFDGKPPAEKRELLVKRKKDKNSAKNEFMLLKEQLSSATEQDKQEITTTMDVLKKQFVSINKEQIENVKGLIHACGMMWIDAPGEADQLCASLVLNKKVWACLSDDMDMFVYGATRVLRYLSLMNHTVVLYHTKNILKDLSMTQKEFCEMCILSGTD